MSKGGFLPLGTSHLCDSHLSFSPPALTTFLVIFLICE
jgi:hypothetical protein